MGWRSGRDAALFKIENEKNSALRAEAAEVLCDLGADASEAARPEFAPAVVRLLGDTQSEVRAAGLALAALILPGDEAEELLIRHLSDRDVRVRIEATGRLADLRRPTSRGAFAQALRDELFPVRFEAARGMAELKHSAGLEVLIEALDDGELRFRAVASLAELGDREALPALQRLFTKWFLPPFDRTQAAGALVRLGDPTGAEHLFKRAARRWSADRGMAIELLGEVKAVGARERLEEILKDPTDLNRGAAARALGRLADPSALPLLEAVLSDAAASDDLKLDVAEGLCLYPEAKARAPLQNLQLSTAEARAELSALLCEPPAP